MRELESPREQASRDRTSSGEGERRVGAQQHCAEADEQGGCRWRHSATHAATQGRHQVRVARRLGTSGVQDSLEP